MALLILTYLFVTGIIVFLYGFEFFIRLSEVLAHPVTHFVIIFISLFFLVLFYLESKKKYSLVYPFIGFAVGGLLIFSTLAIYALNSLTEKDLLFSLAPGIAYIVFGLYLLIKNKNHKILS